MVRVESLGEDEREAVGGYYLSRGTILPWTTSDELVNDD